jgi:hypothetical protein
MKRGAAAVARRTAERLIEHLDLRGVMQGKRVCTTVAIHRIKALIVKVRIIPLCQC